MTLITRSTKAGPDPVSLLYCPQIPDLIAGEDLDVAAPCYIKTSDGKAYMSNGTAVNEAAEFVGFTARAAKAGQPITLVSLGARFQYGSSLSPGAVYYIGATAGRLDSAATVGDTQGTAMAINSTDIIVIRAHPLDLESPPLAALVSQLNGSHVDEVANDQTTPGLPVIIPIAVAGGAAGNEDVVLTQKVRVIDVWAQHTGGAGEASDTIRLYNGANAISDAMSWAGADAAIVRAASIDDAYADVAAAGTLRVTTTDNDAGSDVGAGIVYVLAIPIA